MLVLGHLARSFSVQDLCVFHDQFLSPWAMQGSEQLVIL